MKVTKKKNGKYIINSNNIEVETYESVIVKYNLLYKELDEELVKLIYKENEFYEVYDAAIKHISKKLRSEHEIKKKFKDFKDIDILINELKKINLLDDRKFAYAYTIDKMNFNKLGKNKIKSELIKNKIDRTIIEEVLEEVGDSIFSSNLEKLVLKKITSNQRKSKYMLRQKILQDLYDKGYESSEIDYYFEIFYKDDPKIYEKELKKVRLKLSKKYSDTELDNKVKEKMFKLGFRN